MFTYKAIDLHQNTKSIMVGVLCLHNAEILGGFVKSWNSMKIILSKKAVSDRANCNNVFNITNNIEKLLYSEIL